MELAIMPPVFKMETAFYERIRGGISKRECRSENLAVTSQILEIITDRG